MGIRKPDPRVIELAIARCGATTAQAWTVGDGDTEIEGADRAGIRSVWLHRGRTWTRTDFEPDRIVTGLLEALTVVQAG